MVNTAPTNPNNLKAPEANSLSEPKGPLEASSNEVASINFRDLDPANQIHFNCPKALETAKTRDALEAVPRIAIPAFRVKPYKLCGTCFLIEVEQDGKGGKKTGKAEADGENFRIP